MVNLKAASLILLLSTLQAKGDDDCATGRWQCGDKCQKQGMSCNCGAGVFYVSDHMWCCFTETCGVEEKLYLDTVLFMCPAKVQLELV